MCMHTVFQIEGDILHEPVQRCLAHEEVVNGKHARDGIVLLRLPPLRCSQLIRIHEFCLENSSCSSAQTAASADYVTG